jgi:ligand-binding sensor protein
LDVRSQKSDPTSTLEIQRSTGPMKYDLDARLLEFSVGIIRITEALPATRAGNHIAGQLLRSGTSAHPNHGEAQAAESGKDFVHKMSICLKENRSAGCAWFKERNLLRSRPS